MDEFIIFTGNSNPDLADKICKYLNVSLGGAKVKTFSDGEIQIEIDENVRLKDVFIIQSTCSPVNDNLVELLLMIDACNRSSANRITAVIPYYGYARQDKKQIQGYFNIPVDNLFAAPVIIEYIKDNLMENLVIVSPDAGGVERARAFAKRLDADLAIIDKRRSAPNQAQAMAVVGDVQDKVAIILDDMVDTAGTLTEAAAALKNAGAREVHASCAHPVLSGPAIERVNASCLKSLVITDTIPLNTHMKRCKKLKVLTISELVGEAIIRSHTGDSVTSLFV
jgi:ribose-phosphate pyrophosphokinase